MKVSAETNRSNREALFLSSIGIQSAGTAANFDPTSRSNSHLGEIFMLEAMLMLLRQHPEMAPVYAGPYRRMLIRDFP